MTRRRAIASVAVAMVSWGCTSQGTARQPVTLRIAVRADVTGIYPSVRNESYTFAVNSGLFEGLTRFDRNLRPEPAVADRWESPDDRTWMFHIRPGIRFSNGDPVRAADVVASIRFATHLDTTEYLLASIESVDEVSKEEVRIRTKSPFPVLLAHLPGAYILPASALDRHPVPTVGTGPFRLEAWLPGKELDLVENPFFRGPRQGFERVSLRIMPEAEDRVRALLEGRVEIIDNVPLDRIQELRRQPRLRTAIRPSLKVLFLILRTTEPHFASPLVRQALELAIDRDELVARALNGFGTPAAELVPPAVLGYNPTLEHVQMNRSRARELLKAAGYPKGFAVPLEGPTDRYTNGVEIMREVARQLGEIGLRVSIDAMPKERFFAGMDSPRWDLVLYGWSCETVQAGELLDEVIHTPKDGSLNLASFSDPRLDQLIDAANRSASLAERARLLGQALKRVGETRAFVPLVTETESFAFSTAVDWDPSLDMALRLSEVKLRRGP